MSEAALWGGLAVGMLFGAAASLGDFCLLRSLSERRDRSDGARLRMFVLAIAVALAGSQFLASQAGVALSESVYAQASFSLPAVVFGGVLFGLGMVMANSCGARALVLGASGNLRSWVVLLCLGLGGYATLRGILQPFRQWMTSWGHINLESGHADLSSWLSQAAGLPQAQVWWVSGLLPGLLLAAWALKSAALRANARLWGSAIGVGLAIVAGWAVTGYWAFDEFDPTPPASLSYIVPVGQSLLYAMLASAMEMDFSVAAVLGTALGAGVVAAIRRQLRWQGFVDARQTLRYMAGGVLMGVGGVLAVGCSIGQALTGLSTLAIQSFVATAAIVAGACLGLRIFDSANNTQRG